MLLAFGFNKTTVNGQQTLSTRGQQIIVNRHCALVMHTHGLLTVVRCLLTITNPKFAKPTLYIKTISLNIISTKSKQRWSFLIAFGYLRQQTTVNGQQTSSTGFFQTENKKTCVRCLSLSKAQRSALRQAQRPRYHGLLTVVRCLLTSIARERIIITLSVSLNTTTL